ncbi:Phage terminase, large subunit [Mucinivorans hirudinis]|uniref:Phage terminase, large subunit n=1 Tax=Mucinivorans hirudinis TaxID=1433126 RepID=A0A060RD70_9BACT|nr:Phage terminase, large subunit [Mucinivorans hirudinis]
MISVPPQHGKSLGTSTLLPAYMLGLDPNLRICIGSYSFSLARRFGLSVQRVIDSPEYEKIFPQTFLKGMRQTEKGETALRTADEFDIVGAEGGLRLVGRECSLTGNRVDVMILDDLYKDAAEANSPLVREAAWDWYTSVVRTRLHNNSREIVVFTRWHEDDLIGRLAKSEKIIDIVSFSDISRLQPDEWARVNFEAIKESAPTELDSRPRSEPLWKERHSLELLEQKRRLDPSVFEALYQGNPRSKEGFLYSHFQTYESGGYYEKILNYTDVADTGNDRLCSVCYAVDDEGFIRIIDVIYSPEPMEVTELEVAAMLSRNRVATAVIESNNGGRGFARAVQKLAPATLIKCFHQGANKESRILTNASAVMSRILMPEGWQQRWREFADELTCLRRNFRANAHDDAADTLTGIIETEITHAKRKVFLVGF